MMQQTEQLKKELIHLEQIHKQSPTEVNLKKLSTVRTNLNGLQTEHAKKHKAQGFHKATLL